MGRKLKVYRTPIGFHDAYVAAASQKAALRVWGSDADLFARGMAEAVTDEVLTRAPLAQPGIVIRLPRGTNAEHLAALPADRLPQKRSSPRPDKDDDGPAPRRRGKSAAAKAPPAVKSKPKPKPRPSRAELDEAEQALDRAQAEHDKTMTDIGRRENALQQERRALEERHDSEIAKREASLKTAGDRYRAALQKWRD
jgi:hypothetical protein